MRKREKQAIISFFSANRGDGYRRCSYMMIDEDVAYASPSTVYRVLKEAGMLQKKADDTSRGKGFKQPLVPHEGRRKKIHAARLKRKQNVLREEIKLNKLEYKLTSQKLYSNQL